MPKLKDIAKKGSAPSKILHMALPDDETLTFWKITADDPGEYAARVARFSRALGKDAKRTASRSPERLLRDAVPAVQSRRYKLPGKLLIMPSHPHVGARSSARELKRNSRSRQG